MAKHILEENFLMDRISAVICEFNPFHKGHEALLSHASAVSDVIICVMSGNFTQRSECAVYDKYTRAKAAVLMGADLVLELPFPYASAGGETFAFGGVSVGGAVGASRFIFGSESGDTEYVKAASALLDSDELSCLLESMNDPADGAAVRHDRAMTSLGFSLGANDKLGAQYIRAARRANLDVSFEAFRRMCDPACYRSATEIRRLVFENGLSAVRDFIPESLHGVYPERSGVIEDKLAEIEYNYFRLHAPTKDEGFFECDGGVFERLRNGAASSRGHEEFFAKAATKRYTDSRLRRSALFALLGVKRENVLSPPAVTVLLGASEKGRKYLGVIRKNSKIKIITKPSDDTGCSMVSGAQLNIMRRGDELYSLCLWEKVPAGEFLRRGPYIE